MHIEAAAPLFASSETRPLAELTLMGLAKARFASERALLAFAGPEGLTRGLLDTWVRVGLVRRDDVVLDLSRPEPSPYFALTREGARQLGGRTISPVFAPSASMWRRSAQTRGHDVLIGDFALAVLRLAREGRVELKGLETDDSKFATSVVLSSAVGEPQRVALQADAYVLTKSRDHVEGLLVEVDRGTVSLRRMKEKYAGYLAWARTGGPTRDFAVKAFRLLTLAQNEHRLAELRRVAHEANDSRRSGFLLFATTSELDVATPERFLESVARVLGDASRVPIFTR